MRFPPNIIEDIFSSHPARFAAIIEHDVDLFEALARSRGGIRQIAQEVLGLDYLRELNRRSRNPRFRVSRSQAREIVRFFKDGPMFALDSELVVSIRNRNLGSLLESDHLIEQRFIDAIAGGNVLLNRRIAEHAYRNPTRVPDVMAVAVPKNEIVYYRIARETNSPDFQLAGLYPHVGPGSKTSRMAQFIPVGTENTHSVRDIANAHRWVINIEQGLPAEAFEDLMLIDIAHAIEEGINNNNTLGRQLNREIGAITTEKIVDYLRGSTPLTMETFSPLNWTRFREIEMPTHL